jgi:hypothetical protein
MVIAHGKSSSKLGNLELAKGELRQRRLGVKTVTPAQLVDVMDRYARTHGRTPMLDGEYTASVSALGGLANGLTQLLDMSGRAGKSYLSGVTRVGGAKSRSFESVSLGNPMRAPDVVDFITGYRTLAFDYANDPVAAALFTSGKLGRLMAYLRDRALRVVIDNHPAGRRVIVEACTLYRDAAHAALSVDGFERAGESGKARRECLSFDSDGGLVFDFEAGARGQDLRGGTGRGKKQDKRARTAAYTMALVAASANTEARALCVPSAVRRYVDAMDKERLWPVRAEGEPYYLFPLLASSRNEFVNKPLNAGAVTSRLKGHLTAMGEYSGETSHSYKRTGLLRSPLSDAEAAKRASLAEATVAYYRDTLRQSRGGTAAPGPNTPL